LPLSAQREPAGAEEEPAVPTYIAFLRAVNVAGHGVVKMEALRDACAAAGCRDVRTYIQSGNVVFDSPASEPSVVRKLGAELGRLLGKEPGICLRTLEEIALLVEQDPFRDFKSEKSVKLYVAFLAEPARAKPRFPLLLPKDGLEAFAMSGREVFIVSRPNPAGFYGFPNNFIEKELKAPATTRNWNTVAKIVKFAKGKVK
jgi:uncharacterized protein (DUF1697 family)